MGLLAVDLGFIRLSLVCDLKFKELASFCLEPVA